MRQDSRPSAAHIRQYVRLSWATDLRFANAQKPSRPVFFMCPVTAQREGSRSIRPIRGTVSRSSVPHRCFVMSTRQMACADDPWAGPFARIGGEKRNSGADSGHIVFRLSINAPRRALLPRFRPSVWPICRRRVNPEHLTPVEFCPDCVVDGEPSTFSRSRPQARV
jgi:hypothetical protein